MKHSENEIVGILNMSLDSESSVQQTGPCKNAKQLRQY